MANRKWIPWPGIGQVDKQKIAPIVDNPYFRRLSDKRQLALTYLVFPGATHDRRQHSGVAIGRHHQMLRLKRQYVQDDGTDHSDPGPDPPAQQQRRDDGSVQPEGLEKVC